jgi:hypothetical protein
VIAGIPVIDQIIIIISEISAPAAGGKLDFSNDILYKCLIGLHRKFKNLNMPFFREE